MITNSPFFSLPGEGQKIIANGIELFIKATVQQTNGLWSMIEYVLPPSHPGPALHYHKRTQEMFYILEGTLLFTLAEQQIEAPAGTLLVVPQGAIHKFENISDAHTRFQVWFSPGGMEQYFIEVQALIHHEPAWPPADMNKLITLMEAHDMYAAGH